VLGPYWNQYVVVWPCGSTVPLTRAEVALSWNPWPVVAVGGVLADCAVDVSAKIAKIAPTTIAAEKRLLVKVEDFLTFASLRLATCSGFGYPSAFPL
jgi:hypothetical protein